MSTASFPTSVQTIAAMYVAVNELQNNLNGSITSGATSLILNSSTNFPTYGTVLIDNEVILYTGITGNTLTGLTRGFDSPNSVAAAHSNGAVVSFAIVADHHNILAAEIHAIENFLGASGVNIATNPLSANLSAGGFKITNLANGTAATDAAAFGQLHLLQTPVISTNATSASSSSTTFADTGLSATITPKSASSTILILSFLPCYITSASANQNPAIALRSRRDTTTITTIDEAFGSDMTAQASGEAIYNTVPLISTDAPGDTSAHTYKIQYARSINSASGTVYVQRLNQQSILILLEVV